MIPTNLLFQFHLFVTIFMTGVIWVIQLLNYPAYSRVPAESFEAYHHFHVTRISWIVVLPMIAEVLTFFILLGKKFFTPSQAVLHFSLLLTIWLSTMFLQVPQHNVLQHGFNSDAHQFLVSSNWVRTISWTLRSFLLCKIFLLHSH